MGLYSLPVSCLAHASGYLPGVLLPVSSCKSLLTHASTGDPLTLSGRYFSVSWSITASFLWVLLWTRFCLYSPRVESLFSPVLWKSCNQISLALKVSQTLWEFLVSLLDPQAGKPYLNLHNRNMCTFTTVREPLWFIFLQFVGHLPSGCVIWLYHDCALLQSCWSFFFSLDTEYLFSGRFQHPPVNDCSTASCDFGGLTGDECTSFYSVILNQSLFVVLIGISLMVSDVQPLFLYLWPFVHIWRNVYSSPLPIFKNWGFFSSSLLPFFSDMFLWQRRNKLWLHVGNRFYCFSLPLLL